MRYKITYLICIPLMVLIGMWGFSRLCDVICVLMYGWSIHYIEMPRLWGDGSMEWYYPRYNTVSFYYIAAIIAVIWMLKYTKKHFVEGYRTVYQICIPLMVIIGLWLFGCVLWWLTGDPYIFLPYIHVGVPIWPSVFSFYMIAAIISIVWELIYARKHSEKGIKNNQEEL